MGGIPPILFLKYFIDKGHDFNVGFIENGELCDETMIVTADNFEEFSKKLKSKK